MKIIIEVKDYRGKPYEVGATPTGAIAEDVENVLKNYLCGVKSITVKIEPSKP